MKQLLWTINKKIYLKYFLITITSIAITPSNQGQAYETSSEMNRREIAVRYMGGSLRNPPAYLRLYALPRNHENEGIRSQLNHILEITSNTLERCGMCDLFPIREVEVFDTPHTLYYENYAVGDYGLIPCCNLPNGRRWGILKWSCATGLIFFSTFCIAIMLHIAIIK
jgi:hypothetical protein